MPAAKAAYMSTDQTPMKVNSRRSPRARKEGSESLMRKPIGEVSGYFAHSSGRLRKDGIFS